MKDKDSTTQAVLTSTANASIPINKTLDEPSCINAFQIISKSTAGLGKNSPPTCVITNKRGEVIYCIIRKYLMVFNRKIT